MHQLDTGATAWMLTSASLVLLMTPALALFDGGMSRSKSVLTMMMMSFGALGVVGVVYVLWGWSMSDGPSVAGLFGNPVTHVALAGSLLDVQGYYIIDDLGVPATVGVAFQLTFAVITVALISGVIADRVKFSTWMVFTAVWVTLAFFPMARMVWGGGLLSHSPDGLAALMFGTTDGEASVVPIDFAGGTVVHINAGVTGLVLAKITGRRLGFGADPMRPHNLPMVMFGAALLWFGWFGFNAGSAFTAVIGVALRRAMGWRIDPAAEAKGIDLTEHAEAGYETLSTGRITMEAHR